MYILPSPWFAPCVKRNPLAGSILNSLQSFLYAASSYWLLNWLNAGRPDVRTYVYCILDAQEKVSSSILESGGRAEEAQIEFLTLIEGTVKEKDRAVSVQKFQRAVDHARVRLNLAVAPKVWLMPSEMEINIERAYRFNNKLKRAVPGMRIGVNNEVNRALNRSTMRVSERGIKTMRRGFRLLHEENNRGVGSWPPQRA